MKQQQRRKRLRQALSGKETGLPAWVQTEGITVVHVQDDVYSAKDPQGQTVVFDEPTYNDVKSRCKVLTILRVIIPGDQDRDQEPQAETRYTMPARIRQPEPEPEHTDEPELMQAVEPIPEHKKIPGWTLLYDSDDDDDDDDIKHSAIMLPHIRN